MGKQTIANGQTDNSQWANRQQPTDKQTIANGQTDNSQWANRQQPKDKQTIAKWTNRQQPNGPMGKQTETDEPDEHDS